MKLPDIEAVSAKVHEGWMQTKKNNGIVSRKDESGEELMVPYRQLSEAAKDLDRQTVQVVYEALQSFRGGDFMNEDSKLFEGWAIVELFGHQKIAGMCSEQALAGTNMLRVDVPAINGQQPFTRFFGGGAIYAITPTDQETALIALRRIGHRPVDRWVVPDQAVLPGPAKDSEFIDDPGF
jgi:hypothetical protein